MMTPNTNLEHGRQESRRSSFSDISITYEGASEQILSRPPDLSTHGMFINTNRSFPYGAVLNVSFRLNRTDFVVQARCEVRYCLQGVGIGVEFLDLSPEAFSAIEAETGS
jgi:hypothetical protein